MESAIASTAATPALTSIEPPVEMTLIATNNRIEALDVVRGFALFGIFLMNIEFFNRPFSSFGEGMPRGLTGLDWLASWFIAYFVQGKFWTIFSLLFGMGFAVMMLRAEQAGREFIQVYLRRVLALAVFGALHFIFIWEGDILFTYAVSALMLMVALYGKAKQIFIAMIVTVGLGLIPDMDNFFAITAGLAITGLIALYLRGEKKIVIRGRSIPLFSFLLLSIGVSLNIAAAVFWLLPDGPIEPRLPLTVFGPLVFITGWLSWKYYEPVEKRSVRLGASLYMFGAMAMLGVGLVQYFAPDPYAIVGTTPHATTTAATAVTTANAVTTPSVTTPTAAPIGDKKTSSADAKSATKTDQTTEEKKQKKTREQRAAEGKAEREKRLAEGKIERAEDIRIFSNGTYAETLIWSGGKFPEKVAGDFGTSMVFIGVFLLGMWFVRSGVMEKTGAHLDLFRKLALYGLPIGIGLGLLGSMIAMSHTPGDRADGWVIARGLITIGNLPACLGYVGMVVLMLHSKTVFARVSILAPLGRMALTNYLLQSLICALYFYGYALGHWGMPRAQQIVFVLVVYSAQIAFSHWWLSKFRYGPMEWIWRGFTYRQLPKFRI